MHPLPPPLLLGRRGGGGLSLKKKGGVDRMRLRMKHFDIMWVHRKIRFLGWGMEGEVGGHEKPINWGELPEKDGGGGGGRAWKV